MLVFICVFFLVNVALKKLMFQEQTNSELIVSSLVVAVIVGLILFFKQKEKTSKDN
jgi:L-asparagine transporter-like permease